MKQTEKYVGGINSKNTEANIVVCIGAHNERDWITPCVHDIYKEVDRIIIVEGAVEGRPNADKNGHSTDGTVDIILEMDDPDDKIELVQQDRHWKTLEEQKQQFINLTNEGDWLLIKDADEIWHPRDIVRLRSAIRAYSDATEFVPLFLHFWGDTNVLKRPAMPWNVCHQRFFRRTKGQKYVSHPIITDGNGIDTCLSAQYQQFRYTIPDLYIYHYGYCKPLEFQKEKMEFYDKELVKHNNANVEHRLKYEEHQNGTFEPKSLLRFTGEHPDIMRDHPIMSYKYPHIDDYNALDDYKSDFFYKDGARIPLIPNWMHFEPRQMNPIYRELRFI